MAALVQLSCLETFPRHLNPFHVFFFKSQFSDAFPNNTEATPTLLFTSCASQSRGVLLCAHIEEQEAADVTVNTTLTLYTSRQCLRHHGLTGNTMGTVRLLAPFALTKVVIGASTRQSFKWATSERFSSGLVALLSCCPPGQVLLAREGDPLSLPHHPLLGEDLAQVQQYLQDLVVLECTPLTQGMITVNTSLVVTDCWDPNPDPGSSSTPRRPDPDPGSSSTPRRLQLLVSDFAHCAGGVGGGGALLDNNKLLTSGFSGFLQLLECRVDVRVVDTRRMFKQATLDAGGEQDRTVDADSSIFVSKELLLKLGLFNREWVLLSRLNSSWEKKSSSKVQVPQTHGQVGGQMQPIAKSHGRLRPSSFVVLDLATSTELDPHDNVGFISPTHWFNVSDGEQMPVSRKTMRIKRWNTNRPQPGPRLSESPSRSAAPPFAKEIHLEPIASPEYNPHGPFDSILHQHFTIPRLTCQGDVLTVAAEDHPERLESSAEGIQRFPVVYFKVKNVCGSAEEEEDHRGRGAYLADRLHTSLYMGVSTNSLAPCVFVGEGPSLWTTLSPPGLSGTVDQIISIILPHSSDSFAALSGCTVLLQGPHGAGKVTVVRAVCRRLHLHFVKVDCVTLCSDTAAACEAKLRVAFQRAASCQPCVLLLRNLQLLGAEEEGGARVQTALCQLITDTAGSDLVVVIATVSRPRDLSVDVRAAFVHQVSLESLGEEQRRAVLVGLSQGLPLGKDVSLARLAKHTAGFLLADLRALLNQAGKAAHRRLLQSFFPDGWLAQQEEDLSASGATILTQDFSRALETLQAAHSHAIGAPKIPSVRWQDVGGLQQVKREILDTVQLPLDRPELLSAGLQRSGLLLHGPPGTGKTLLAKAVATECSMTFLSVKGPELLNMYVGQSEENVREVFSRARGAAPCIIFFDELDSLAPSRGHSGDSGGVMDRVVSQLLAELDGLDSSVFVIGATNRPDLLDQSLLRPGRFDKLVYVGINEDKDSQLLVLKAIVRKFQLDPGVNLEDVVERCPARLTGADMYALCSDAMTAAIKRKISRLTDGLDTEDSPLMLSTEDFSQALESLRPSVSNQELLKYQHVQQKLAAK